MQRSRIHSTILRLALAAVPAILSPAATGQVIVNGWSQFNPSADTRQVYVSSSSGNDANSGLSAAAPKQTIAAGYAVLRDGYPDWLLLKSGDVWNETFPAWNKSGRSSSEMMLITSYSGGGSGGGSGGDSPADRPHLFCGGNDGFYAGNWGAVARGHLALTDIWFTSTYDGSTGTPDGVHMLGRWDDVLVENCYAEHFCGNFVFDADLTVPLTNLRFRRNVSVEAWRATLDAHPQGSYFAGVNGLLLEECVLDHNGWREDVPNGNTPTIFRHNIYIQGHNGQTNDCFNVTTRGLITARAAATGMQQRAGGLAENHLILANPVGYVAGTGGTIRNCVVMDSRDIDSANPRGLGMQLSNGTNYELSGNICAWRTYPATWNLSALSFDNTVSGANVHDNIVWKWWVPGVQQAIGMELWGTLSGTITVRNNQIQMQTGGDVLDNHVSVPLSLSGNTYYSPSAVSFEFGDSRMAYSQWASTTGETGSSFAQGNYPDPNRSIATYMAMLGRTQTLAAFMTEARLQSKANWRPEFTASAVNDYIRAGFGINSGGGGCPGDLDGDGVLNENDMIAFQKFFYRGDMRADVNHDGVLSIQDFTAYQVLYNAGCH